VVRLLLENGDDIDTKGGRGDGWTTLHQAAEDEYVVVVQLLLEKGTGINTKNRYRYR